MLTVALGLVGVTNVALAAPASYELDYEAADGCPDIAGFVAQISARARNAEHAPGHAEFRFVVRIGRRSTDWWGHVDLGWRDWCPLQESYSGTPGGCGCLPNWTGHASMGSCSLEHPDTHQTMQVSCAQFGLCMGGFQACACSVSGCRANEVSDVHFDLELQGGQLDGSMTAAWWGDYPVHLNRVLSAGPSP
ncbi:MAG: hypothetical protein IPI67_14270 [Myxococcales bacterium]|nr:hypothetical protein [Myxococcales bacterium]